MKESWKTINHLLNKISKSCNVDCLEVCGNTIINEKDISDTMNNLFCTIGESIASKIDPIHNPLLAGDYNGSDKSVTCKSEMQLQKLKLQRALGRTTSPVSS